MMKIYYGVPSNGGSGPQRAIVTDDATTRDLATRDDLVPHSKDGFAWGKKMIKPGPVDPDPHFLTRGDSQLALAILADHLRNDKEAIRLHLRFRDRALIKLARNTPWAIDGGQVQMIIDQIIATENDPQTQQMARAAGGDRAPVEHEVGRVADGQSVWDTDDKGNRIRPRGE